MIIRPVQPQDTAAIAAIYAHHVKTGTGTFEIDPPTMADMQVRIDDVLAKGLPYLVLESHGLVLGFAYCNWFKPRPAYRFSAEDSIYLAPEIAGKGWGKSLMAELIAKAERVGVRKLIAVIGDSANLGSVGLHRSVGFSHVGTIAACGWKFERWLDIVLMERTLGHGALSSPV